MKNRVVFIFLLLLLAGCSQVVPTSSPAVPSPAAVSFRVESRDLATGGAELRLIVRNSTAGPVYLPMCGPWTVYRLPGATRVVAWQLDCESDYLAYELPAGRSVAGVISLTDPAVAPYYLEAHAGEHLAEVTVFSECQVGEPVQVATGPKYGELDACGRRELLVSQPFQIQTGAPAPVATPTVPVTSASMLMFSPTSASKLQLVGQLGGVAQSVAFGAGHVLAAVGPRLLVLEPETLDLVGQTAPLPDLVSTVVASGDRAYLALQHGGLVLVDLSDVAAPQVTSTFETSSRVQDISLRGSFAFLASGAEGVQVLDTADAAYLDLISRWQTELPVSAVTVAGDLAYLMAGSELIVLDISELARPVTLSSLDLAANGRRLLLADGLGYVAAQQDGIRVIDLSDPAAPTQIAAVPAGNSVMALAIVGDSLLAADYHAGLTIFDRATLAIRAQVDTPGVALDLVSQADRVYLADYTGGIRQVGVSDPGAPNDSLPNYVTLGWVNGVSASGSQVVVAGTAGLGLVEVSDPANPRLQHCESDVTWVSEDVVLDGERAYVVDSMLGLRVFDLTAEPVQIGSVAVDRPRAVAVRDQIAFLAHADGLSVIDVSSMPPVEIASRTRQWEALDLLLANQVLYVADGVDSVWAYDISNPARPVESGQWQRTVQGLALGDAFLAAAAGAKGLRMAAVADPLHPVELGHWPSEDARAVTVLGPVGYLADAVSGIHILDLRTPADPVALERISTPGTSLDIATNGEYLLVADAAGGLLVLAR